MPLAAPPPILICGAGIAGLTAALALLQRGLNVLVLEQSWQLAELGAGVQIAPNGARVLQALGLNAAMSEVACVAAAKEVRLGSTGQRWPLFDLGEDALRRFGAPYWLVHRGDLHEVLRQAVLAIKPDAIALGVRGVGFDQATAAGPATGVTPGFASDTAPGAASCATPDATSRTAPSHAPGAAADTITLHTADGGRIQGAALIAADGVHSALRQAAFGAGAAEFTGLMAWRGVVPMQRLPAVLQAPLGVNHLGAGGHVITYPLRRGELLNFVGIVERSDWRGESWSDAGTREACAADFVGWHDDVQRIIAAIDTPYRWALLSRPPLTQWSHGRLCVIGDAAHPMLPMLGQGANMALEDGLLLARCLAELAPSSGVAAALQRFEALRIERCTRIVQGSADNAKRFHNPVLADPAAAAGYIAREWEPGKVRQRYDWLFEHDVTRLLI